MIDTNCTPKKHTYVMWKWKLICWTSFKILILKPINLHLRYYETIMCELLFQNIKDITVIVLFIYAFPTLAVTASSHHLLLTIYSLLGVTTQILLSYNVLSRLSSFPGKRIGQINGYVSVWKFCFHEMMSRCEGVWIIGIQIDEVPLNLLFLWEQYYPQDNIQKFLESEVPVRLPHQ